MSINDEDDVAGLQCVVLSTRGTHGAVEIPHGHLLSVSKQSIQQINILNQDEGDECHKTIVHVII